MSEQIVTTKTKAPKVAREVAEAEFEKFAELMWLDVNPEGLDADDKKHLETAKRSFVRACMDGFLSVNSSGEPVLKPQAGGDPITFHEPKGEAIMARDSKKQGHDQAKLVATMVKMTGETEERFKAMVGRDFKVCEAITILFLA